MVSGWCRPAIDRFDRFALAGALRQASFMTGMAGMAGNTFGQAFTLATFGESHGPALGTVVDGCPLAWPLKRRIAAGSRSSPSGSVQVRHPAPESDAVR